MGEAAFPTLVQDLLDRACPPQGELDEYLLRPTLVSTI